MRKDKVDSEQDALDAAYRRGDLRAAIWENAQAQAILSQNRTLIRSRISIAQETYAALTAAQNFANAMMVQYGVTECSTAFPQFNHWFNPGAQGAGEVLRLLDEMCDCCGASLVRDDLLGRECYAVGEYEQVCPDCMSALEFALPKLQTDRRVTRLHAFALQAPASLAGTVVIAIQQTEGGLDAVLEELRISTHQLLQLALFSGVVMSDPDIMVATIAVSLQCDPVTLRAFLERGTNQP